MGSEEEVRKKLDELNKDLQDSDASLDAEQVRRALSSYVSDVEEYPEEIKEMFKESQKERGVETLSPAEVVVRLEKTLEYQREKGVEISEKMVKRMVKRDLDRLVMH